MPKSLRYCDMKPEVKRNSEKAISSRNADKGENGNASKPVSLNPLTFDEALGGLLATDANAIRELERKAKEKRARNKKKGRPNAKNQA